MLTRLASQLFKIQYIYIFRRYYQINKTSPLNESTYPLKTEFGWGFTGNPMVCMMIRQFQEKSKREGLRIYFFENLPGIFHFFYFTPGNSRQNEAHPPPQNCVRSLGNSKAKNKHPWKFHLIFLGHPSKFHFVFN